MQPVKEQQNEPPRSPTHLHRRSVNLSFDAKITGLEENVAAV